MLILGLTTILGVYTLYLLLDLPERIEWFQLYGLLFYIILFAIVYLFVLTVIGIVARLLKNDIHRPIFRGTIWSFLLLTVTTFVGSFIGEKKVNKTEAQMATESKLDQQRDSIDYLNRLDSLTIITKKDTLNYEAIVAKGVMKRNKGLWEASIIEYKKALEINSNYFCAHSELAYSDLILKNYNESLFHYKKALAIDSSAFGISEQIQRIEEIINKNGR